MLVCHCPGATPFCAHGRDRAASRDPVIPRQRGHPRACASALVVTTPACVLKWVRPVFSAVRLMSCGSILQPARQILRESGERACTFAGFPHRGTWRHDRALKAEGPRGFEVAQSATCKGVCRPATRTHDLLCPTSSETRPGEAGSPKPRLDRSPNLAEGSALLPPSTNERMQHPRQAGAPQRFHGHRSTGIGRRTADAGDRNLEG